MCARVGMCVYRACVGLYMPCMRMCVHVLVCVCVCVWVHDVYACTHDTYQLQPEAEKQTEDPCVKIYTPTQK